MLVECVEKDASASTSGLIMKRYGCNRKTTENNNEPKKTITPTRSLNAFDLFDILVPLSSVILIELVHAN